LENEREQTATLTVRAAFPFGGMSPVSLIMVPR
jgi:hypothetical protein